MFEYVCANVLSPLRVNFYFATEGNFICIVFLTKTLPNDITDCRFHGVKVQGDLVTRQELVGCKREVAKEKKR